MKFRISPVEALPYRSLDYHTALRGTSVATCHNTMEPDEMTKQAVQQLVQAVKDSVDDSPVVRNALKNLEFLGYVPDMTVKMDLTLNRPMIDQLTDTRVRVC